MSNIKGCIAEYQGQTVEISSDFHYSADRKWIVPTNGKWMKSHGYWVTGCSAYEYELSNIRPDVHPAEAAYELEKAMDDEYPLTFSGGEVDEARPYRPARLDWSGWDEDYIYPNEGGKLTA